MNNNCTSCEIKAGDNTNANCPIKGDYRLFTDYRPRCAVQYTQMINNEFPSSYENRLYLIQNASELMKKNSLDAYLKSSCDVCVDSPSFNDGTMLREFDVQKCNSRTCTFTSKDSFGLGRGRQYFDDSTDDDMTKKFIEQKEKENEWFKSQKTSTANSDNIKFAPIDGAGSDIYSRYASTPQ